jgi:hypothetical protein
VIAEFQFLHIGWREYSLDIGAWCIASYANSQPGLGLYGFTWHILAKFWEGGAQYPLPPNACWRAFCDVTAAFQNGVRKRKIERASFLFGNWARMTDKRGEWSRAIRSRVAGRRGHFTLDQRGGEPLVPRFGQSGFS